MKVTQPETSPADDPVAVRIRGVAKHFGTGDQRVLALRGVDWDVYKGQMSLIVGPSGCGKTTLLSVIAGILDTDEGDVSVFGQRSRRCATARRRGSAPGRSASSSSSTTSCPPSRPPRTRRSRWSSPAGGRRRPSSACAGPGLARDGQEDPEPAQPALRRSTAAGRHRAGAGARPEVSWSATSRPPRSTTRPALTVMELLRKAAVRPDRAVVIVTHDNRVFHFGDRIARMDDGRIVEIRDRTSSSAA